MRSPRYLCNSLQLALFAAAVAGLASPSAAANTSPALHKVIDGHVGKAAGGPLAPRSTDSEFLRRIYLDLTGSVPMAQDVRAFLADRDAEKRRKLIDRLLSSPEYPRRMAETFDVFLMERRTGDVVPAERWRKYLEDSFAANKPWDQLVRELVTAACTDPSAQPALRFFADGRAGDPHRMTQDVSRLFLGMNLGCAQCHDHPTVADFKQAHYFGLYAYLGQSKLHKVAKTNETRLIETAAEGKTDFASVFAPDTKQATGPRLLDAAEIPVPAFAKGEEVAEPARDGLPAVPKFRPRELLARDLTLPSNRAFARSSVNRVWFMLMGRGLVHPLDLDHRGNPASHPELLEALTQTFLDSKFDLRMLVRQIVLSETYQRSGLAPPAVDPRTLAPHRYRVANAKPLSAEQLAWSTLRATGNLDFALRTPAPETAFNFKDYLNGRSPEPPDHLPGTMTLFAAVFGNPPGEPEVEFQPSMSHSLFLMNEKLVQKWLEPRSGNLVDRLSRLPESPAIAEELYLSVVTRLPNAEEKSEVAAYLQRNEARRSAALGDLVWALLASAEFRLNH